MNAPVSPSIILDLIKKEKRRRNAQRKLLEFTRQSFEIIEPGQEFVDNWHLGSIAEHLEAVTRGDLRNLVINIPPGCMKSILTSVCWPAWDWANDPTLRILNASYGVDLAIRDADLAEVRCTHCGRAEGPIPLCADLCADCQHALRPVS